MARFLPNLVAIALLLFCLAPAPAAAQQGALGTGQVTGLPLPRFVSLRSSEANMRSGPGLRYPITWIYHRRGLPLEVIAEADTWRKVRDWEGTEGWMHQSMLGGERRAQVLDRNRLILRSPQEGAPPVAQLEPGVIGNLEECEGDWCRLSAGGYGGWLRRAEIWGVYPGESLE